MKKLIIVIPEGPLNLISVTGAYKSFVRADELWQGFGNQPRFQVQVAGFPKEVKIDHGLFVVKPLPLSKIGKADLIIIPAIGSDYAGSVKKNQKLIAWISEQYVQGAEIASICVGAFLLAATGIVDGRQCSTHWMARDTFRAMFPKVDLKTDKLITDECGIYTNGGAMSFMNLMLYLIEKYYDRKTAILCSKVFQVDIDRNSQSPYTIFSGQKNHDDELVKEAQLYMEKHFDEKMSMDELASNLAAGRRNFDRRFIKATGNTPMEYLQRTRIEAAKKNLEISHKTISEIMYEVGYSDTKAFRETFKKITGLTPLEYKQKYNKEAMTAVW
ncbi:MAG: helix-turn-helix domain-containing protein [Chitinophagaceae bacterium]|nr:MAG: helix-turn-helix domain-containing protein [Chitinophagaceae bacterium]